MPNELISIEFLGSLAGMAAAVTLVVSFLKWAVGLSGRGAKLTAWLTGAVLVGVLYVNQGAFAATGVELFTAVVTGLLNSIIVTLVAMKAYEEAEPVIKQLTAGKL